MSNYTNQMGRMDIAQAIQAEESGTKIWDGKGDAPSRASAIAWAMSQGMPRREAERIVGGSKKAIGTAARKILREYKAGKAAADAPAQSIDADGDGKISTPEAQSAGTLADDIFGDLGEPGVSNESTKGSPLWPYDTSGMTDDEVAGITVAEGSPMAMYGRRWRKDIGPEGARIGARYYAADALSPLRWSAERRADLQRLMHGLGLYGDKKIRLGTWTASDQDVFTAVLEYSNVGGTKWAETLAGWRKAGLPPDLAQKIADAQPKRPTIQVTNPLDIRAAAQDVSTQLTGTRDDAFAMGAVSPYQGLESAAQSGVYGDQEGGGGGTVTEAPSMGAFLEDKLRREQPLEVDGYQFLGQFQNFMSVMGL